MPRQIQGSQFDFSYGEVDIALKRNDSHPARKGGLRQMSNMRILNSGSIQERSGRTALFPAPSTARIEEVTMSAGNIFKLSFGAAGQLRILNSAGAQVALFNLQGNGAPLPWLLTTVGKIVYAQFGLSIYFTFPGMRPQVVTWDGLLTWTIADYTELLNGGQKRTLFYRISPHGITLQPGAQTGTTSLTSSFPVFTAAHVGTRMRFVGRQMLITGVTNPLLATVAIQETLPGAQTLLMASNPSATFSPGDSVIGTVTNSTGTVFSVTATQVNVQLSTNSTGLGASAFAGAEVLVGPSGSLTITSVSVVASPLPSTIWDEEVINTLQGYPASCFVDQFRLGFCNFPTVPGGIAWSSINSPTDLYVVGATQPAGAIFELAPDKVQVLYVVPGPESSEFVFCDKKLYYIKIDVTNPLKPGSVGFQILSSDGCAQVQPRPTQELILYANAGANSVMAINAPGAYYRPFNTVNLCDFHSHLFNNIQAIAVPTADGTFNERYAYVLNGDGSISVGKYTLKEGQAGAVGWGPWNGAGVVSWISAFAADVLFTTTYFGNFTVCEILDDSRYLDASVLVNAPPTAMAPQFGKGPLWWAASQSVFLMDQVTRPMGVYQVDANGFIVPQNNGGENLAAPTLMAGLMWTATIEPFAPDATSGTDMKQRMELRQYSKYAVYVIHSTGLMFASIFAGKQTRTGAVPGVIEQTCRVPAYNMDDDTTIPPLQRETVESWTPPNSSFDPRCAIILDRPGPLQILEFAMEISI
jgi:hypothetical protein